MKKNVVALLQLLREKPRLALLRALKLNLNSFNEINSSFLANDLGYATRYSL